MQEPTNSTTQDKRRVYFNEFNTRMHNTAYLPLVSGLLRAYAETSDLLKAGYEFMPFLFYRDAPEKIIAAYENPSVAAFSVTVWNEQLNLKVAQEVKLLCPECLVVFGGPQVPQHPEEYFKEHPFIDVAVRGEGEEAFFEILVRLLQSRDFSGIAGVSWRDPRTGMCVRNQQERTQSRDLDVYPSPYLKGLYDDLFLNQPDMKFQAIVETNRGCPFLCTYCFWGQGGLSRKYRFHGMERVRGELEWMAQHEIRYVYNADSNFGMHRRDMEIARMLVDIKNEYGFPEKFHTCYGKNTDDKIYDIAKLFYQHDLHRGITLSRQSNDDQVLINIKRDNIKMSTYRNLQVRLNEENIPTYCELILGLPGESYETWVNGIQELLESGLKDQIILYICQVLPNTDLADPDYQKQFGIVTRRIMLTEIHGTVRENKLLHEYQDIVVSTSSMPPADWRRMMVFSWMIQLFQSMKLGFFVLYYLNNRFGLRHVDFITYISECRMPTELGKILREEMRHYHAYLDRLLEGNGLGHIMPGFGNIYWDAEEATYLRISSDFDRFYDEMLELLRQFLIEKGVAYDESELREAVQYQRMRIPSFPRPTTARYQFMHNFPEYFETCYHRAAIPLTARAQILDLLKAPDYEGDRQRYARDTVLNWRTDADLTQVKWHNQYAKVG